MRHWSLLGIRNWRTKPGRTAGAIGAIALGVGVVVWVTCAFESIRMALRDQTWFWVGKSHISVESVFGRLGTVNQSIVDEVKKLPNVAHITSRLKYPMRIHRFKKDASIAASLEEMSLEEKEKLIEFPGLDIDAVGIDPDTEYLFRDYEGERFEGCLIAKEDTDAAVVDRRLAESLNLKIGDRFALQSKPSWNWDYTKREYGSFKVVGLLEHRRVAKRQLPVVIAQFDKIETLAHFQQDAPQVTSVDIMLADASGHAIRLAANNVSRIVRNMGYVVISAEGKVKQFEAAEKQTGFVLLLLSCVALFTAFFIIFSTLSMGMTERIGQLGMLRCLGVTRWQLACL
ncbi:MAG: hypothetical protein JSV03_01140, partial [Planctomycetota bacterium]